MNSLSSDLRPFGIVQGRLSVPPSPQLQWFPQNCWQDEFTVAQQIGIQFIELLAERQFNPSNPLWSHRGRDEIKSVSKQAGRLLYSSCLDYIIDHAVLDDSAGETQSNLEMFLEASSDLGCKVIILPLLEKSDLNSRTEDLMVPLVRRIAHQASNLNISICIESLMEGLHLKSFLENVNEPNVKCVYDTGNRVGLGIDVASEIRILADYIGHVHIKDKNVSGQNVLLGTGLVNFSEVFEALQEIAYDGPLVFETTRGRDPVATALYHMTTCNFFSREASQR